MHLILVGFIIAAIAGLVIWGGKDKPQTQDLEKKNPPKFFRIPTFATIAIGVLGAIFLPGIAIKGAVLFMAAISLCVLNWEWFFYDPKEVKKAKLKKKLEERLSKTPINRLKRQLLFSINR